MEQRDKRIDQGRPFDWGRASADYARFRDIYPQEFYESILRCGLGQAGQRMLDIGTGTGVLPRHLYSYGAKWTGIDVSPEQIQQARRLSQGMAIDYLVTPAEDIDFPGETFDGVTACQCFTYFHHEQLANVLKPGGRFLVLYMAWLPGEDAIARASEDLVLQYNPQWSGAGETLHPIAIPDCYFQQFRLVRREAYTCRLPFTRESWHGRMRACRGVGASLSPEALARWEQAHLQLLETLAPASFDVLHYVALAALEKK